MKPKIIEMFNALSNSKNLAAEDHQLLQTFFDTIKKEFEKQKFKAEALQKSTKLTEKHLISSVEELEEKNIELNKYIKSNIKLENFAYVASHDLKTPLRTILNYINLLREMKNDQLDEQGNLFLSFIFDSSKRLERLIDDMLAYSIVGTNGAIELVDINKVVLNCMNDLQVLISEKNATITFDILPHIKVFKTDITSLFRNIISNSIKYSKQNTPPILKIGFEETNNAFVFSFADNGIGFDIKKTDKMFQMFQRLENALSSEGTGIGLALCKKIVELHKGEIWVDSQIDVGSTFYFSIPKTEVQAVQ